MSPLWITPIPALWVLCGLLAARWVYVDKDARRLDISHGHWYGTHYPGQTIRGCAFCMRDIYLTLWLGAVSLAGCLLVGAIRLVTRGAWLMLATVTHPTKREQEAARIEAVAEAEAIVYGGEDQ